MKKDLLEIYRAMDVLINGEKSPLMVAVQKTTASLVKCFEGKSLSSCIIKRVGNLILALMLQPTICTTLKRIPYNVGTCIF